MKSISRTLVFSSLLLAPQTLLACPMCKDSIPGAVGGGDPSQMSGGGGLPGGFNTSVYIMLVGFFATLGLVGWTIYKGIRS